jgi:hypothetical protein
LPLYVKQFQADIPFQGTDMIRNGGLGKTQFISGGSNALFAGNVVKNYKSMKV